MAIGMAAMKKPLNDKPSGASAGASARHWRQQQPLLLLLLAPEVVHLNVVQNLLFERVTPSHVLFALHVQYYAGLLCSVLLHTLRVCYFGC